MKRTTLALAGVVLLSACSTSGTPTPEENAAMKEWGDCVMAAVIRLDDGRSDPMSIAYGVAPLCGSLYAKATNLAVQQFITENGQANMRQTMKAGELKAITSAVLIHRSKKTS
jgi:hypothetical protein